MRREVSKDSVFPSERMRGLIEQHARFIREYVTGGENYDEAHRSWMTEAKDDVKKGYAWAPHRAC